jgi:DNA polymerase elongation subunit (family B)
MLAKMINTAKEKIACIHRHHIDEEHVSCFMEGNVIDNRENKLIPWYQEEGLKVGILDIEVSNLDADWNSQMLTWCIKDKDGPTYSDYITKEELFNGTMDKRLIQSLLDRLANYKIIIGYYSNGFDIPYIRTKCLHYDLEFPGYELVEKRNGGTKYVPKLISWDLYPVVKYKLKLSRRSLDSATSYLNIPGKTPIGKEAWAKGAYGDPESIQLILSHNIADCEITDQLHTKLTNFNRWGRNGA